MRESQLNETERAVQQPFRLGTALSLILLFFSATVFPQWLRSLPDRPQMPDRAAAVRMTPVHVADTTGAWVVEVADPRFGGVSAMVAQKGRLLALTDSGVSVSLPKPGQDGAARLHDLPAGPGRPIHRRSRDSEALAAASGGGWLVAFENRHSIWRYDADFKRVLGRLDLRRMRWSVNKGIEAMVPLPSGDLLLIPEIAGRVLRLSGRTLSTSRISGLSGGVADAALLPDGRVLLLIREVSPLGIRNRIAELSESSGDYRVRVIRTIKVGPLTNMEALTAEPLPSGATRLWVMSDNDFSLWRKTVLLAIDLPASADEAGAQPAPYVTRRN